MSSPPASCSAVVTAGAMAMRVKWSGSTRVVGDTTNAPPPSQRLRRTEAVTSLAPGARLRAAISACG